MAARRRSSPVEDLMDLVAMLPWWAGVAIAIVLYLVLHMVASQPVVVATQPGQIGTTVTQGLWKSLATVGQYVLPLTCLAGSSISAWRRWTRQKLAADVVQSSAGDALNGMSWQEFEMLVGEGFRLQGYQVLETGGGGADGGVDLVLRKDGEKFLVQCKQWRAFKVGVQVVRELYGVMAARGATGGFVVTSGRFTNSAVRFASGRNIDLVDGPKLQRLLQQANAVKESTPMQAANAASAAEGMSTASIAPTCPACGGSMVRRTAKRGANAGAEFWGCQSYPACRGTRPVSA